MSTSSLFGMETELAMADLNGVHRNQAVVNCFLNCASKLPSVASEDTGYFLANGARLYLDHGGHVEYSTPEVTSPDSMIAHLAAQEKVLLSVAKDLEYNIRIWRANVCYFNTDATWASHESHLYTGYLSPNDLIPHLITRILYTGSGGLELSKKTAEFSLSPRAVFFQTTQSIETTHDRGIYNTRDESLSNEGYRRLHIIFGDTLCSHKANWLRIAITNLIVLLSSHGVNAGKQVQIDNPIATLQEICRDVTGHLVPIKLTNGKTTNAIDIQRHYLDVIRNYSDRPYMPDWTTKATERLEAILDALNKGTEHVATQLDWAMKYTLFNQYLENNYHASFDKSSEFRYVNYLHYNRQCEIHYKLAELDIRFGELGENGIFNKMDSDGILNHRIIPDANIDFAVGNPPPDTRAKQRGQWIDELYKANDTAHIVCNWDKIIDTHKNRWLDFRSPFTQSASWKEMKNHV